MTDFERALEDVIRQSNGSAKTLDALFELIVASHRDTRARIDKLGERLDTHCEADEPRERRAWLSWFFVSTAGRLVFAAAVVAVTVLVNTVLTGRP